jgi:2-phosphoglycerate kinase
MVANRLGIVRIVSTDAVREVMRGIFTKEMMPSLHTSSFEVTTLLKDPPGDADPVIAGFRHQVHAVAVGLAQLLQRALIEGTDLIIEGAHIVPGFLRFPPREAAIVVPSVISIDDEQVHRSHFVARASDVRSRGDQRYLDHFDDIRKIQDYVRALALEHGVPVISSHALDLTVKRVMELVVSAATDAPHLESPPAPPVQYQTHSEVATGG